MDRNYLKQLQQQVVVGHNVYAHSIDTKNHDTCKGGVREVEECGGHCQ